MEDLIDKIVKEYPDFAKKWIEVRLKNEINTNKKLPDEETIMKIRDCLASLDENSKTIKKLDKISFKDMNIIQDKWHKALAKKAEKLKEFGGNPFEYEPVLKCDNGFQWVRLDTPESKDYEGNAMGHCVGSGGYDDNRRTIFSLRDKDNIPHITVEFDKERNRIKQIQGKGNTRPNEKYYDDIIKLYGETGSTNYDKLIGHKTFAILNNKLLIGDEAILACPEDTVFDSVKLGPDSKITEWKHSVKGDFDVFWSNLEYINPDCKFGGDVNIDKTYAILNDKILLGDEAILGCQDDTVFDYVKLKDDSKITEWNCSVKGDFKAYGSKLESVSPDCVFGGKVNIEKTNIKEWHCDVSGDFNACDSKLEYVNPECKFGGDVIIGCCDNIKEWHCDVSGDFYACDSKLEYVNPECKFGGDVDIEEANIREWNCDVGGNFIAKNSKLERIVNCEIKGSIYCDDNVKIINEEKQTMRM